MREVFENFLNFCQGFIISLTGTPVEKLNWKIFQNDELIIDTKKKWREGDAAAASLSEKKELGWISERDYQHVCYLGQVWREDAKKFLNELETENSELKLRRNLLLAQQEVIDLASCFDKHEQVASQISRY